MPSLFNMRHDPYDESMTHLRKGGLYAVTVLTLAWLSGCETSSGSLQAGSNGTGPQLEEGCECEVVGCGLSTCGTPCGECGGGTLCVGHECTNEETCTWVDFTPTNVEATSQVFETSVRIRLRATTKRQTPPFEQLTLEMFHNNNEESTPFLGLVDLAGQSENDCTVCPRIEVNCDGTACERRFLPVAGQVFIEQAGEDGRLKGRISGAQFRETYVDPKTGVTYDVPKGETWCVPDFEFDQNLNTSVVTASCVAEGTGKALGAKIADHTLTNCLGEKVDLHSRCGAVAAVWLVGAAGWCSSCEEYIPKVRNYYLKNKNRGLEVRFILGEDENANQPTGAICKKWAESHGLDPSMVLLDHDGTHAWQTTWSNIESYAQGTIALPWEAVLKGADMEYLFYSHGQAKDPTPVLDALLGL